jgi:hypothetical protein
MVLVNSSTYHFQNRCTIVMGGGEGRLGRRPLVSRGVLARMMANAMGITWETSRDIMFFPDEEFSRDTSGLIRDYYDGKLSIPIPGNGRLHAHSRHLGS